MSEYKPTFEVSPPRRPWYRRLTPVAWGLIGVAGPVLLENKHAEVEQ